MELDEQPQTTLRDSLESAFDEHSETVDETPARVRDESGRFAKQEQEATTVEKIEQEAAAAEVEPPKVAPRPSSWKKDYEQDWEVLPDRIREYINEREGQYAKGVSTYKNQWDQAAPIYEAVAPFLPELQQHNIQPQQWIQNLGNAHRTLAMGSPDQKLQMFAKLATDYGVPLQALMGQPADPQFSMIAQELNQVKGQLQQFETLQQQHEQQRLQQEIDAFAMNAPHFETVRETMGMLLQSGMATDLKTAYDKASRLHDDVFQQQQAQQASAVEAERHKVLAEKKAKAVSPKSASPTGAMNAGGGKKSLRDQLAEAVDASLGGHI